MSATPSDQGAGKAVGLLLRGDVDEGIALYGESLRSDDLSNIPVGLHLLFLERAGQLDAAERLRRLAVRKGANLALKAGGFGAELEEAAGEYEALFAGGLANSRMVFEYLRVLAQLGRMDELRRFLDRKRLLRLVPLDAAAAGAKSAGTGAAVEALLRRLEPEAPHEEAVQSVRNMRHIRNFSSLDDPAATKLMRLISDAAQSYLADWRSSGHPLAQFVPPGFRIKAWGLISTGAGYNIRHIHPVGWATGVYYPTAIEPGSGGELMIGRPENAAGSDADWQATHVRPEAGLLVLMPSYYTHWTNPLTQPGVRMSIAFDVLAEEQDSAGEARSDP